MLQWEIIESQVGKDTHLEVQLNLDSNLVPTLPPPILITIPSHSNTLESIIERQLPAVSTSSGMIPISSQPPSLFNEAAHNTSQPLYYSRRPPINPSTATASNYVTSCCPSTIRCGHKV
ncbi:hypothetical protein KY284_020066 [Solanum tuberosum]|nr:hypothetical protein KY284_020066 [Solanum tuberosum]